jgi:hypothetical protein
MATKLFSFLFYDDDDDDGCHVVTKVVMFDRGKRETSTRSCIVSQNVAMSQ